MTVKKKSAKKPAAAKKQLNQKTTNKKTTNKKATNLPPASRRKHLTEAQLQMTCTELMAHLMCSKATAWRALRRGFYCPGYNGNARSRETKRNALSHLEPLQQLPTPGTRVRLKAVERRLSRNALAERYRIGHTLASEALRHGGFRMPIKRRGVDTTSPHEES